MIQSNILLTDIVIPTVDNLIVTDVQDEVIIKDSDIMSTTLTIASLNSEFIPQESQTSPSLLDLNTTEFNNLSNEIVITPTIQDNGMLLNPDIPVYDNAVPTELSLNTNSQSNSDILDVFESVDAIPGTTPGSGSLFPSDPEELPQINSLFELLQYLSEVMMRFNSDPKYYMQDDFAILVKTITNALIHLYLNAPLSTGEVEGLYAALGTKVDKILGKGLSTNDLTDELKAAYDQAFLETHIHNNKSALDLVSGENTGDQDLSGLQPKETGKGLSTNDFTNLDRTKLDGIQAGAEANVNADWNATSGDALILNKPNIPDITGLASETYVQNYAEPKKGTDDNYVTDIEKANLHAPHSDDQDLSGLVVKIPGYSLVADVEIAKIHLPGSDNQDLTPYETIANNNIKLATKEPANPNIQAHITNTNNPHLTTKAQVGLSAVDNTSDLNKPISIATQNALDTKEPNITLGTVSQYWRGDKTFQTLDKNAVGLDQVDNTSDLLKPISTATQSALDLKLNTSLKGVPDGLAELDSNGFVKNTQLPSYVDDVLEYTTISLAPIPGESGKIYVDLTTNITYRWSGTQYSIISDTLALGETSSTAFVGDKGKIAYDHSQIISGNPHNTNHNESGNIQLAGSGVTYGHIDTNTQSIYGTKTFINSPLVPNITPLDNSTKVANTAYADTKLPLQTIIDSKGLSGFVDGDNINISYNYTNRTITLTGNLSYIYRGVAKTLTSPWTSSAHVATQGTWFLYSTDGTNFNWSQTLWNFEDIMVTSMRYGVSAATTFAIRETHGTMDYKTHEELHSQIGTYRSSGGQVTAGSYTYNTATDSATSPGFDSAVVKDEDISSTISAWVKGTYTTAYVGAGNTMVFNVASTVPFIATTNTFIQVNNPITGTLTAGSNNNYYNVYQILIPATSDVDSQKYRMIMLQPQNTYSSLALAQAEDVRGLVLGNLAILSLEFVIYTRITYVAGNPNNNIGKCRIATNGITYNIGSRAGQVSVAGFTGNNHSVLSNLSWLTSGHTGSANKLPTFDASGLATELTTNSAFNKSFGTSTTQVWGYDAHPTTLNGYGITDTPWTAYLPLHATADSATLWGGMEADFITLYGTSTSWLVGYEPTSATIKPIRDVTIKSFLGLGSSAYTNTNDHILNQNSSAQSAYMWISGSAKIDGGLALINRYDNSANGSIIYNSGSGSDLIFAETAPNVYTFGSGSYGSVVTPTLSLNISTRAATFASTVKALQLQSTVATGTVPLTVNSTTMVGNLNSQYLGGYENTHFAKTYDATSLIDNWNNFNPSSSTDRGVIVRVDDNVKLGLPQTSIYNWSLYQQGNSMRGSQLALGAYGGNEMYYRSAQNDDNVWRPWVKLYHSGNLTNTLSTKYIPKWNGSSMTNSSIIDDGANINFITGAYTKIRVTHGDTGNYIQSTNVAETTSEPLNFSGLFGTEGVFSFNGVVNISSNAVAPLTWGSSSSMFGKLDYFNDGFAAIVGNSGKGLKLSANNESNMLNIYTNGNTSIGYTTDQGYKLAVSGGGFFNGGLVVYGNITNPLDNTYLAIGNDANIGFTKQAGASGKMTFNNSTSFVIAQSSGANLSASNTFTDKFTLDGNGNLTVTGSMYASNFILSSDRTLKTNIQPIIKDYSRLNLVSFNFKNNLDELRFGTIAQDLLSNGYSEFVTGDKEGEYKVKYIDLIIAKLASAELRIKELEDKYGSR